MRNFVPTVNQDFRPPSAVVSETNSTASLIYDREGHRKYLTAAERRAFLEAVGGLAPEVRTFCRVLAYSGARISEVLALTSMRIDTSARLVVFESLKKRRRGVFRAVPLPTDVLAELELVHALAEQRGRIGPTDALLWPWSRTFAWMQIKEAMAAAYVIGPQATPKGLRHSFGVTAIQAGVPINLVRRWLGHSRLSTTEIYTDAIGPEEQAIASRLWETF